MWSEVYLFGCVFVLSFLLISVYKKIALKFNIVDIPNRRSSHIQPTIRGAGIIFPIIYILLLCNNLLTFNSSTEFIDCINLIVALLISSSISFIDDIYPQSIIIRSILYLVSLTLIFLNTSLFALFTINENTWVNYVFLAIAVLLSFGIMNTYNFMDGINGILVSNSIITVSSIFLAFYLNSSLIANFYLAFIPVLLVFAYFNFRKRALLFAGDIGSISISLILIIAIFKLIQLTHNFSYLLFFSTFVIDSWLTILFRLIRREPLHKPHRSHLYQFLYNEKQLPFWKIAVIIAIPQITINYMVILRFSTTIIMTTLSILIVFYILIRLYFQGFEKLFKCYDSDLFPRNSSPKKEKVVENDLQIMNEIIHN
jgi:UDP-N-acetylmuramyl pentapeptide phosphotransferase/UDP-N-acetylglucosamine-1-phosphate transferase